MIKLFRSHDLINELIRKMPDFTYQKYRDLVKARKEADTEVQLDVSKQIIIFSDPS